MEAICQLNNPTNKKTLKQWNEQKQRRKKKQCFNLTSAKKKKSIFQILYASHISLKTFVMTQKLLYHCRYLEYLNMCCFFFSLWSYLIGFEILLKFLQIFCPFFLFNASTFWRLRDSNKLTIVKIVWFLILF